MKHKLNGKSHLQLKLKIKLYIMSLWLLFVLIFMLTIDIPLCFWENKETFKWLNLLQNNWLSILSLIMVIVGMYIAGAMQREWDGVCNPPVKIKTIKNENYEYLTFLTTYIIPLICIDLTEIRYIIILIVLLILIGYIFISMDLYYGNPTLALMGYKLYRAEIEGYNDSNDIILISKDYLLKEQSIKWIIIDENVWLAKEVIK